MYGEQRYDRLTDGTVRCLSQQPRIKIRMNIRVHRIVVAVMLSVALASVAAFVLSLQSGYWKPEPEPIPPVRKDSFPRTVIDGVTWPTAKLVKVTIVDDDFSVELATGVSLKGSFSVFSPVERHEDVVAKQPDLQGVLRAEIATSVFDRQLCVESPWLIKADHSGVSARTNFSAARLITVFNDAIGASVVLGFECDLE